MHSVLQQINSRMPVVELQNLILNVNTDYVAIESALLHTGVEERLEERLE